MRSYRRKRIILLILVAISGYFWLANRPEEAVPESISDGSKRVVLMLGRTALSQRTQAATIGDFLAENRIILGERDRVFPPAEAALSAHSRVWVEQARPVFFREGKKKTDGYVTGLTVGEALAENGIALGADDLVVPGTGSLAREGEKIELTRVEIKMEKEIKKIDFKKNIKEDEKLGWREKKTIQAGKYGEKELTYRAVYHDGKLISRKLQEEKMLEEPTEEIAIQGTYVKLGKKHDGMASWYAFKGGLFAANPWLPMGSYVKVTNIDNGKSVIVKINDRGPFVPGRIIDLDKVAFQKIASLGAGVVHVKMEEVLN